MASSFARVNNASQRLGFAAGIKTYLIIAGRF